MAKIELICQKCNIFTIFDLKKKSLRISIAESTYILVVYSRSHISQEISSPLEVLFKKVILKIGFLAAMLCENNKKKMCILECMLNKPSEKNSHSLYYTPEETSSN